MTCRPFPIKTTIVIHHQDFNLWNIYIMELIVNLSVILFFIGLWMYARYWRRMCGKAFCQYAAACCGREEREKLMRYAIIAGNRHAPLLYALTYPERFDKARPLRLFEFRGIRCVFA